MKADNLQPDFVPYDAEFVEAPLIDYYKKSISTDRFEYTGNSVAGVRVHNFDEAIPLDARDQDNI